MKKILLFFGLTTSVVINAQEVNIIPLPVEILMGDTKNPFILNKNTTIILQYAADNFDKGCEYFNTYLLNNYGFKLKIIKRQEEKNETNIIRFTAGTFPILSMKVYGYTISVKNDQINIRANIPNEGLFNALQTLIQLLPTQKSKTKNPKISIPQLEISDYPRFQYRGMHLDVGRHFFPISFIKKYIDYLALHKLNIFHWHLTEDQGWRIEIKKYPELTSVGGWRNGTIIGRYPGTGNDNIRYGGSYTQEEIKEVVQYAKERYIEVIPEIEMPGHSSAAIAAYPWLSCFPEKPTEIPKNMISKASTLQQSQGKIKLVQETWGVFDDVFCAGNDSTFLFLQNVIDEVITLFPSKYFHIGGDECPKKHWKICPKCQQRMKELGLKDEHELQSYFVQRIEKYLNSKGKTLIGWDEILEGGLAPKAVVMSWRGEAGGIEAAKQKHNVIMTPGNPVYFDHSQSENEDSVTIGGYNPIEKVYAYEPVPKELSEVEGKYVLGAQANVWTEYMGNEKKVEYMIFPRMAALSEVLWSPKENSNWENFEKRLPEQMKRYEMWGANYSKAFYDLHSSVLADDKYNGLRWSYSSKIENSYRIKYKKKSETNDTIPVYSISDPNHIIKYEFIKPGDTIEVDSQILPNMGYYHITHGGVYTISAHKNIQRDHHFVPEREPFTSIIQEFHFNKATGNKIALTNPASDKYPGDGAFTLVNGVINEKGFARSREFLGFNGTDCEAVIDLGLMYPVSFIVINTLNRTSSWIWRPSNVEAFGSGDGKNWYSLKLTDVFEEKKDGTGKGTMTLAFRSTYAQYIKVIIKNQGIIPEGNPGAGNKAWLFVDEIEVN